MVVHFGMLHAALAARTMLCLCIVVGVANNATLALLLLLLVLVQRLRITVESRKLHISWATIQLYSEVLAPNAERLFVSKVSIIARIRWLLH